MSVLLPEARVAVKDALPALGALCFFIFAWGLMHGLDRFCRALFGTLTGAVGWIPGAGGLITSPIHKIEQKVSHLIGGAERGIDAHIASSWHKLSRVASQMVQSVFAVAVTVAALGAYVIGLPAWREIRHLIHAVTRPLRSALHTVEHALEDVWNAEKALKHWVDHQLRALLRGLEAAIAHAGQAVIDLPRWGIKPLEKALADLRRWLKHRRIPLTTGAFIGAFVWALGKLGLRYLRCSRSKAIQKELCSPKGDWLLGLLEGGLLIVGTVSIVELAKELQDEMAPAVKGITALIREQTG